MTAGKLEIEQVYSTIGCTREQRATVKGLGLRHLRQRASVIDTPAMRGMIAKVAHLVSIVGKEEKRSLLKKEPVKKKVVARKKKEPLC